MEFCIGIFLTALKICKAASIKQKLLGEAVFKSICPNFYCADDDSAISAVFRGKRNINSYLQLAVNDLEPSSVAINFEKFIIPLLDENKNTLLVRILQDVVNRDDIDDETHVELVNMIKKKELVEMNDIVLSDFLAGLIIYAIKNTNNLNKEAEVKWFKKCAMEIDLSLLKKVNFIKQYPTSSILDVKKIRYVSTLYKKSRNSIDVISADLFDICSSCFLNSRIEIVIPVNTTFETRFKEKVGAVYAPLVSPNTIHGQWINFISDKGIGIYEIDKVIIASLEKNKVSKCASSISSVGKKDIYPLASIASVDIENVDYYLVAISSFEENNRAYSNAEIIKKSINAIVDYYDINGQGYDLYIPLLGSGRSRTGLSSSEAFKLISNILIKRKDDIYGKIHIVIHPDQINEIELEV